MEERREKVLAATEDVLLEALEANPIRVFDRDEGTALTLIFLQLRSLERLLGGPGGGGV